MRSGQPETLCEYLVVTVGLRRAIKVATFLAAWGIATEAMGHPPTMQEYADFWKGGLSSAYRERLEFLEAFPEEDTPERLWEVSKAHVESRKRDRAIAQLLGMPFAGMAF